MIEDNCDVRFWVNIFSSIHGEDLSHRERVDGCQVESNLILQSLPIKGSSRS